MIQKSNYLIVILVLMVCGVHYPAKEGTSGALSSLGSKSPVVTTTVDVYFGNVHENCHYIDAHMEIKLPGPKEPTESDLLAEIIRHGKKEAPKQYPPNFKVYDKRYAHPTKGRYVASYEYLLCLEESVDLVLTRIDTDPEGRPIFDYGCLIHIKYPNKMHIVEQLYEKKYIREVDLCHFKTDPEFGFTLPFFEAWNVIEEVFGNAVSFEHKRDNWVIFLRMATKMADLPFDRRVKKALDILNLREPEHDELAALGVIEFTKRDINQVSTSNAVPYAAPKAKAETVQSAAAAAFTEPASSSACAASIVKLYFGSVSPESPFIKLESAPNVSDVRNAFEKYEERASRPMSENLRIQRLFGQENVFFTNHDYFCVFGPEKISIMFPGTGTPFSVTVRNAEPYDILRKMCRLNLTTDDDIKTLQRNRTEIHIPVYGIAITEIFGAEFKYDFDKKPASKEQELRRYIKNCGQAKSEAKHQTPSSFSEHKMVPRQLRHESEAAAAPAPQPDRAKPAEAPAEPKAPAPAKTVQPAAAAAAAAEPIRIPIPASRAKQKAQEENPKPFGNLNPQAPAFVPGLLQASSSSQQNPHQGGKGSGKQEKGNKGKGKGKDAKNRYKGW